MFDSYSQAGYSDALQSIWKKMCERDRGIHGLINVVAA